MYFSGTKWKYIFPIILRNLAHLCSFVTQKIVKWARANMGSPPKSLLQIMMKYQKQISKFKISSVTKPY